MVNDTTIYTGLLSFFILLGLILPVVNEAFNTEYTGIANVEDLTNNVGGETESGNLTIWRVFTSLFTVFFWSFGELPFIANTILLIPRLIFAIMTARFIWVGGGN